MIYIYIYMHYSHYYPLLLPIKMVNIAIYVFPAIAWMIRRCAALLEELKESLFEVIDKDGDGLLNKA